MKRINKNSSAALSIIFVIMVMFSGICYADLNDGIGVYYPFNGKRGLNTENVDTSKAILPLPRFDETDKVDNEGALPTFKDAEEGDDSTKLKVKESYGKLPLSFIQNHGQLNKKVKYYEKGSGHSTYFTNRGVYLVLTKKRGVYLVLTKKQETGFQDS